jgi:hypothetical protein
METKNRETIKHTSAPWNVSKPCANTGNIKIKSNGNVLAIIPSKEWGYEDIEISKSTIKANSHIMATAPELLNSLEGMLEIFADGTGDCEDMATVIEARRVIKKSKGVK